MQFPGRQSPSRDKTKMAVSSPVTKTGGKKSDDEFDFLDEINSSSRISGSNLASIKQFFGHKSGATVTSHKPAPTLGAGAKKFASGKHSSARDPSPRRPRADSEGSYGSQEDYGYDGYANDGEEEDFRDEDEGIEEEVAEEDNADALQEHWNLATYLPDTAAQYFLFIIGMCVIISFYFKYFPDHMMSMQGEFLGQYKAKREQLLLIKQRSMHQSDSGVFTLSSASGTGVSGGDETDQVI